MAPVNRGLVGSFVDRFCGWMNSLPPESTNYAIEAVRIPVGDQVHLAADVYHPLGTEPPKGTILIRTPYGISPLHALGHARLFAARGYQVLANSCRGTFGSEGDMNPGRTEADDGQAVLAWMREQPWYTGSFAMVGTSYFGYTQWSLLSNEPPADFQAAVITTGPHDLSRFVWGTGALRSDIVAWADITVRMQRDSFFSVIRAAGSIEARLYPVFQSFPLMPAISNHFGESLPPWLEPNITQPDLNDRYWEPTQHGNALKKANMPILLTAGWYDLMLAQVLEQYTTLSQRGCNVAMTIGPWTHLEAGGGLVLPETYQWLEEHVAGEKGGGGRKSPVRIFVTGVGKWVDLPSWPPKSSAHELFLSAGSELSTKPPSKEEPDFTFTFDPKDPTPFVGAAELFDRVSNPRRPDTPLSSRRDVLTFTSPPLDEDVEVCGKPLVTLHHSSDHINVDVLVMLSEVDDKGVSHTVSEVYRRFGNPCGTQKDADSDLLTLSLQDCAHVFRKNCRVRVMIAGGSHPRYIRNSGTGENSVTATRTKPVVHTIRHGVDAPSKIVLPITNTVIGA